MEIKDICRICLCNVLEMHSVSILYKITMDKTVLNVIQELSLIQICEQDLLPQIICINCYQTVLFIYNFRQLISTSDSYLKEVIEKKVKAEHSDEGNSYKDTRVDRIEHTEIHIKDEEDNFEEIKERDPVEANTSTRNTYERDYYTKMECKLCGKLFVVSEMLWHLLSHIKSKNYKCESCSLDFKTESALKSHNAEKHSPPKSLLRCSKCPMEFMFAEELLNHEMIHNYCNLCYEQFPTDIEYKKHKREVHKLEKCPKCFKTYPHEKLKLHLLKHKKHEKNMKKQESTSALKHYRQPSKSMRSQDLCEKCGKSFDSSNALADHLKFHHTGTQSIMSQSVDCDDCGKKFKYKSQKFLHMLNEHSAKKSKAGEGEVIN